LRAALVPKRVQLPWRVQSGQVRLPPRLEGRGLRHPCVSQRLLWPRNMYAPCATGVTEAPARIAPLPLATLLARCSPCLPPSSPSSCAVLVRRPPRRPATAYRPRVADITRLTPLTPPAGQNFKCQCSPGYTGFDCATLACPLSCAGHGTCFNGTCYCAPGWRGADCTVKMVSGTPASRSWGGVGWGRAPLSGAGATFLPCCSLLLDRLTRVRSSSPALLTRAVPE
jgi:hypothetical protein